MPKTSWRLIRSRPQSGIMNMALDAAILEAVGRGAVLPTLRLYAWNPPCLSLGYNQPFSDVDPNRLHERGWDIVRRPTGGRAILHTDELTYAVIGPRSDPRLEGGLLDSYRRLSQALFQALDRLGLPVEVHSGKNPLAHHQPVCFENPSDFEITVQGKKIIGSAQARKKEGILQHGSLPLTGDLSRITQALLYPSEEDRDLAGRTLLEKAATVQGVLGREIEWEDAADAFQEAFRDVLHLELVDDPLTEEELERAKILAQTQYGAQNWIQGAHLDQNRG